MRTVALIAVAWLAAPLAQAAEIMFDLRIPRGSTARAPRERAFTVKLVGRAPGVAYRLEVEAPGRKAEIFHLVPLPDLIVREDVGSACDALKVRLSELAAQTAEARATQQALQLQDAAEQAPGCSGLRVVVNAVRQFMEFRLQRAFVLAEGQRLRLRVEKVDAQPETRTWELMVQAPSRPADLRWPAPTEEEWLVGETSRDIVEMALYAAGRLAPDAAALDWSFTPAESAEGAYSVRFRSSADTPPVVQLVRPDPHVWAPGAFQPLAETLLRSTGASARPGAVAAGTALTALQDLRATVIARESARVSRGLAKAMLDPVAHEQAALVRGAFALREASGPFQDTRQSLCRMAAHLALARALRVGSGASFEGRLGEAMVATLALRQTDALAQLDALETAARTQAERSWVAALIMRNTGDWRRLERPSSASLLQRLEHFRALQDRRGSERAYEFLQQTRPAPLADWTRITLAGGATVGVGNALAPLLMPLELAEGAEIWAVRRGVADGRGNDPLASLDAVPRRCIQIEAGGHSRPEVIDDGAWAGFQQRHLVAAAWAMDKHLGDRLRLERETLAWQQQVEKRLGHLTLFPLLKELRRRETAAAGPAGVVVPREETACRTVRGLIRSRPELVTATNWTQMEGRCALGAQNDTFVDPGIWFTTGPPRGTAYDPYRSMHMLLFESSAPELARLRRLAPYNRYLLSSYVRLHHGAQPPPREYATAAGRLVDYDAMVQARWLELGGGEDATLRTTAFAACDKDAETCLHAGELLSDRGLDDDAARAYERAWRFARDRVAVSYSAAWLAQYHFEAGREEQALAIAREGAEVGSEAGMQALAILLERLGRPDEARQLYEAMAERYPATATDNRLCFDVRRTVRAGRTLKATDMGAWRQLFPRGLQPTSATRPGLAATSARGGIAVAAMGLTEELKPLGVRADDFVVGVDGFLVSSVDQYRCLLTFKDDPGLSVTVVRHGQFLDLQGPYVRRRYGVLARSEANPPSR